MPTALLTYTDLIDAGRRTPALRSLAKLPAYQVRVCFTHFQDRCPDHLPPIHLPPVRGRMAALHVATMGPVRRCRLQTPTEWKDADPRAARWLASGGEQDILGACALATCPRARAPVPHPLPDTPNIVGRTVVLTRHICTAGGLDMPMGHTLVVAAERDGTFDLEDADGGSVSFRELGLDFELMP